MEQFFEFVREHAFTVWVSLTSLVTVASAATRLTPTESDDKVVDAILRFLNLVSLGKPRGK